MLSYLAADDKGDPIYINRHLVDADVVLPIGCMRLSSTPGYFGVNAAIYPTFSDTATIDRFRATDADPSSDEVACRRRDADEIAWLLGVLLTIQVVPAAAGGVLHIVAGTADSVERRGAMLCKAAWEYEVPHRAPLVVAAIEGPDEQQTWENVGRAIAAASRVVADDGTIALSDRVGGVAWASGPLVPRPGAAIRPTPRGRSESIRRRTRRLPVN